MEKGERSTKKKSLSEEIKVSPRIETIRKEVPRKESGFYDVQICEELSRYKELGVTKVLHLTEFVKGKMPNIRSPLIGRGDKKDVSQGGEYLPEECFIPPGTFTLSKGHFSSIKELNECTKYVRGGPRRAIYFDPSMVRATIVTCGGLAPGLNVVIREIVMSLWYNYGVRHIWGIKWGYQGFYMGDARLDKDQYWVQLTPKMVVDIHHQGGTIVGSSRGKFDKEKIIERLRMRNINMVFCVGGDGTHRAIEQLGQSIKEEKLQIALVGVPKTIDNDIPIIDKTFGFDTAVEACQAAIEAGNYEANGAENGVGLIKVMGRNAGHIAVHASLASRDVNLCLVPEFKYDLYGEYGVLEYILKRLHLKNHCVIVVAEGAAEACCDANQEDISKGNIAIDPSGNVKPSDIGAFLKKEIVDYGAKQGVEITLKYIDPSYMIRAKEANSADKKYCSILAQNCVHGAMAGFTSFSCGIVNGVTSLLPAKLVAEGGPACMHEWDRMWQRLLASTGQPSFTNHTI